MDIIRLFSRLGFTVLIVFTFLLQPLGPALAQPAVSELTVLRRLDPAFLDALAGSARPSADGATSSNRGHYLDVEFQRATDRAIPKAIVKHDRQALLLSLRIAEYSFDHQNPDGSFQYNRPGGTTTKSGKPAPWAEPAAAAFFLEDFGHTMLLLSESSWFMHDDSVRDLRGRFNALRPKENSALTWLLGQQDALRTDSNATNRIFMYGAAFYLNSRALSRTDGVSAGAAFINEALSRQRPDGTFPELGGFDSSYQAVSLYLTQILYLQADPNDSALRTALWSAIQSGMAREKANLLPSGEMSTQGNTRVTGYVGNRQHIDSLDVNLAFQYYAGITHDPSYVAAAAALFNHYPSY